MGEVNTQHVHGLPQGVLLAGHARNSSPEKHPGDNAAVIDQTHGSLLTGTFPKLHPDELKVNLVSGTNEVACDRETWWFRGLGRACSEPGVFPNLSFILFFILQLFVCLSLLAFLHLALVVSSS